MLMYSLKIKKVNKSTLLKVFKICPGLRLQREGSNKCLETSVKSKGETGLRIRPLPPMLLGLFILG